MTGRRIWGGIRRLCAPLSPARRRYIDFLHGLPLDPDQFTSDLEPPGDRDVIICGSPRTGTTLACAALFQPPSMLTVMEPWEGMRLPPAPLFGKLREEIGASGVFQHGRLDLDQLLRQREVRWCRDGDVKLTVTPTWNYLLGVKWPAYWRYLDFLPTTKFLVCLRHPFEVIGSYKKTGGRVAQGLEYDTAFNRSQNEGLRKATRDPAMRRVLLFDYIHERVLPHLSRPNVLPIRYERWFEDRSALLDEMSAFLEIDVRSIPLRMQPSQGASVLDDRDVALIRRHCRTAETLGYDVSETSPQVRAIS